MFKFINVVSWNSEMNRSSGFKLLGLLGLGTAFALAACGGGGGDPGTPLLPPTAKLTMTPNIAGVALTVGQYSQPVKISGGQKPYYVGQTGGVIPTLLDDGSLYLLAVAPTSNVDSDGNCKSSSGGGGDSGGGAGGNDNSVWIQDSSYPQTTLSFSICVTPAPAPPSAPPLLSSLGTDPNLKITLQQGENLPFTVYNGTAPYTVYSSNTSVAKISGSATGGVSGTSNNGNITIVAGSNTDDTATIAVSDKSGASYMFTVKVKAPSP